jgi:uncharacterized cupin superfamily protein
MLNLLVAALLSLVSLQEPAPVPANQEPMHPVAFRNEYLEVLHVRVPPGQTTLYHTHSHDRVAITIQEARLRAQEAGKPPQADAVWRTGDISALAAAGRPYTHRLTNVGSTLFEIIDVESLSRPDGPTVPPLAKPSAEVPSMRVYTWSLPAGGAPSPQHTHERPYLILAVTDLDLVMTGADGQQRTEKVKAGEFHWVASRVTHTLGNAGRSDGQVVEIELK